MVREHGVRGHARRLANGRVVQVRPHRRGSGGAIGGLAVLAVGVFLLLGHCGSDHDRTRAGNDPSPFAGAPSGTWRRPTAAATIPTLIPRTQTAVPVESEQPHWDRSWLMNYWEGANDCAAGNGSYWVVQPGDSGMYALKYGCFSQGWTSDLNSKCQSYRNAMPEGVCAVWDPGKIMSRYGQRGKLQIVVLTQACLDRADQRTFHQGPLHQDCVSAPTG